MTELQIAVTLFCFASTWVLGFLMGMFVENSQHVDHGDGRYKSDVR